LECVEIGSTGIKQLGVEAIVLTTGHKMGIQHREVIVELEGVALRLK